MSYICLNPQTVPTPRVSPDGNHERIVVGLVCGNREYMAFSLYFSPSFAVNLQWLKKHL